MDTDKPIKKIYKKRQLKIQDEKSNSNQAEAISSNNCGINIPFNSYTNNSPISNNSIECATFNNHKDGESYGTAWSWKYFILSDCNNYVKCIICNGILTYNGSTSPHSIHLRGIKIYNFKIYKNNVFRT